MIQDFENTIIEYFNANEIEPIINAEFDIENIRDAHELVESNKTIGKVVLKVNTHDKIEL